MAIIINDNFAVNIGKPIDSKYSNISTPWASVSAANAGIPLAYRYQGLTVNINGVEYWYKNGVADINLVVKSMGGSGSLTGATNGLTIVYSGTTVRLGGTLTGSTMITDGRVASGRTGIQYGGDYSSTFTNNSLVSKLYVDTVAVGLQPKQAVQVATTGNIVLTGLTTIDGIPVTAGQRVLVKDQGSPINNGVWISSTGLWSRASDFDGTPFGEVVTGDYMWVLTGNTNGGTAWVLTTPDPIIIGTTPLTFALFSKTSNIGAGTGIAVTLSGSTSIISLNTNSQAVINSALTGATNGLSTNGRNVGLGGNLCCNTKINLTGGFDFQICSPASSNPFLEICNGSTLGFGNGHHIYLQGCDETNIGGATSKCLNLGFCNKGIITDSTPSIPHGLQYAGDYSASFCNNSLVTKQYVYSQISGATGTITGATNGLSVTGKKIKLGGILTGNTCIGLNNKSLVFTGSTPSSLSAFCVSIKDNTGGNNCYSCLDMTISGLKLCYQCYPLYPNSQITLDSNGICLYQQSGNIGIRTVTPNAGCAGLCYVDNYDSYFTSKRQIPDIGWVSGYTSGYTCSANNGLTKYGQNVVLGGTLTGNTTINASGHSFNVIKAFSIDMSACGVSSSATFGNNDTANTYLCGNNSILLCSPTISIYYNTAASVYDNSGTPHGLQYGADYSANYCPRSLVDKAYVTGYTQSQSNTVNVYNQSICAPYTATTTSDYIGARSGSTIYLPASPKACQRISIADISGHALDCMIIIVGNGKCINGADCATVNTDYGSVTLINNGTFWSAIGFIN